jgi:phosphotransferase system enzyme I (PtsI)
VRVSICGEMAGDPAYLWVLLGLGLDEISMNPLSIPRVKKILRMSTVEEARALFKEISLMTSGSEIERYVRNVMARRFPKDFLEIYHASHETGIAESVPSSVGVVAERE